MREPTPGHVRLRPTPPDTAAVHAQRVLPEVRMSAPTPQVQPSATDRASRRAARVHACWPGVRVESALLTTSADGDHGHVVVQLGGLTPADVRVELIPVDAELAEHCPRGGYRLFSSQAYGNGCFVFEVALPSG